LNFSDIDSDISSFVLECSLQAGVGLAGIAFRD